MNNEVRSICDEISDAVIASVTQSKNARNSQLQAFGEVGFDYGENLFTICGNNTTKSSESQENLELDESGRPRPDQYGDWLFLYLGTGRSSARSARELGSLFGISARAISRQVQHERKRHLICAVCSRDPGYFLPATIAEARDFCGRIAHRDRELHETSVSCTRLLMNLQREEQE